jgi:hypothetical protein
MDKADPTARIFLASMADLLGAVRLPEGAMRARRSRRLLFFQKRGRVSGWKDRGIVNISPSVLVIGVPEAAISARMGARFEARNRDLT